MKVGKKIYYFLISALIVLALCVAQIMGNTILILACLAAFLALLGWSCVRNFTLPILLFFLTWSPILRTSPANFSFFTFGLVLICFISVIKKRFHFKRYHIVTAVVLLGMSLLSKLLDGNGLTFNYFAFMMLILLFPVVKEEWKAECRNVYLVCRNQNGPLLPAMSVLEVAAAHRRRLLP